MEASENRLAGYAWLVECLGLHVLPHWHCAWVATTGARRQSQRGGQVHTVYPASYWPGDDVWDHVEFALKYEGLNLGILSALFGRVAPEKLLVWLQTKPTGKYRRKTWFLYEFLTGRSLPVPNLSQGNYVELLEPEDYFTVSPGQRVPRQRVINNLLGGANFCPLVRRTPTLQAQAEVNLAQRCESLLKDYSPALVRRALGYLYRKETKSSFEIEQLKPSTARAEKFVALLESAEHQDFCEKSRLLDLQNRIVDARFQNEDYRNNQNYIGQTVDDYSQRVHYVSPKPEDLPALMTGLLSAHRLLAAGDVPPVIHAALVAYGFVFLHPFEDGNGRIHRFLIHNILSRRGATPPGLMFPVSAAMLKNAARYDASLEAFSVPLMQVLEYQLDDAGRLTVQGETHDFYRFMDLTPQAEALWDFINLTIAQELGGELDFLAAYDRTKAAVQDVVDLPERLLDLFIRLCLQGGGHLSSRKREAHFLFLSDAEVEALERAVQAGGFPAQRV